MGRKEKYPAERKLLAVQEYLSGIKSTSQICNELHINDKSFRLWLIKYETQGVLLFQVVLAQRGLVFIDDCRISQFLIDKIQQGTVAPQANNQGTSNPTVIFYTD